MTASTYPVWGWAADPGDAPTPDELRALAPLVGDHLGLPAAEPEEPRPLPDLPVDRVGRRLPPSLRSLATADPLDRARHAVGRSYCDVVRGIRAELAAVPDLVVRPTTAGEVRALLDWCSDAAVAVIPYGGGTSVVGGVGPLAAGDWTGVVSLDLAALSGVLEVDAESRAVRVGAGTPGPRLEDELRPHRLTARFYPQSFERSTVGGWAATRAAGHFSSGPTHVDDLVESLAVVTPAGQWESRRLPASGAGPSPDRLLLGSEGSLGVITDVWLRVQPRPVHRWSATAAATSWEHGVDAVRALVQQGLPLATCRLLDAGEASITGTLTTGEPALVLGLESLGPPLDSLAEHTMQLLEDHGLRVLEAGGRGAAGGSWRSSFLRAPYLREQLVLLGVLVETFETAATWSALPGLVTQVQEAVADAVRRICGSGRITCRLTHVYPDGAAPYFTVFAPARRGSEISQWAEIKAAASAAILAAGGTITHHHAVGRDHGAWYAEQRPALFGRALAAVKSVLDPAGICNPGVLALPGPAR